MTLPNLATTITPPGSILGIDTDAWARIGDSHMAALAVADLAVLMIQPTGMELPRAASVSMAFQTMTAMGMALPPLLVDLTRTNPSAASPRETMQNLREAGETVLDGTLLNSDARGGYAQALGKAPELVPFGEISHLFREFGHTAWRLETRKGYASDRSSPKWARFLAGEDITEDPDNSWRENVRAQTAQGKRFERVRLLDEPATQGQEFLLASGLGNVAAGEDIRHLTHTQAQDLRLPEYDFWLFDSRVVARFAFDEDDTTLGVYVTEDPAEVLAACQARDAAWHHATRTEDVVRQVRSTV
ncbi:DUF6879 family protein [Streptomyces sp. NPDC056121]|uniref:DUF6879 family protein n=1 Tax=Streptomyces sp. NPDC056121 TaxID=3345718 RepID=UPI0035D55212